MRVVAISDTHLTKPQLPDGDLLIHTGDLTYRGKPDELRQVNSWFQKVQGQFKYGILYIAGNHDLTHQRDPEMARRILTTGTYLQDSGVEIEDIKFWGTPWVSQFFDWAFMDDEPGLTKHYGRIPTDTDVILCHGPAKGFLDWVERDENVGSEAMLSTLFRVKPALFVFGHIHDQYGMVELNYPDGKKSLLVNAAICDDRYKPIHEPVVIDLEDDGTCVIDQDVL